MRRSLAALFTCGLIWLSTISVCLTSARRPLNTYRHGANVTQHIIHTPVVSKPLMLLGLMGINDQAALRQIVRASYMQSSFVCNFRPKPSLRPCILVRFILGFTDDDSAVIAENEEYGDIVLLPIRENMNSGKTFSWFKTAARRTVFKNIPFVGKADMDTFIWPDKMVEELLGLHPSYEYQLGAGFTRKRCGSLAFCPDKWKYMSGQFYVLSDGLVQLFHDVNVTDRQYHGHEDLAVGRFLHIQATRVQVDKRGTQCWVHKEKGPLKKEPAKEYKRLSGSKSPKDCRALTMPVSIPNCQKNNANNVQPFCLTQAAGPGKYVPILDRKDKQPPPASTTGWDDSTGVV